MNYNRLRPYTVVTMVFFLILLVITGWILYLSPHSGGAKHWLFLGINKHQYKDIHFCLSVVTTVLIIMHGVFNYKPLTHYLKFGSKVGTLPLLGALITVFLTVFFAFLL